MEQSKRLSTDPLAFIRERIRERKIQWTYHVNMRMTGRYISREDILGSLDSFEIIESYPDDKYLASYLVYAEHDGKRFHILIATDIAGDNVRIITTYLPDPAYWESDLKKRKPQT